MPPEVAEAPIIPAQTIVPGVETSAKDQKEFSAIFNTPADEPVKKQKEKKPESKETPKPADAPKPKQEAKSKRLESLGEVKAPVAEKETDGDEADVAKKAEAPKSSVQSTEDGETIPEDQKKAQSRWLQLKAAEKELNSIKPNFDAIKKELDSVKAKGLIPEAVQKKLDALEQRYAEELVEQDEGFKQEVALPIQQAFTTIGEVAKAAGLNHSQAQALLEAVRDTSEVGRSDAIWEIISSVRISKENKETGEVDESALPEEKVARYATKVVSAADDLHKKFWPKEVEYRSKAKDVADSRRTLDAKEGEEQKAQRETQWNEEAGRLSSVLKERLSYVFEKNPEAEEAIKKASPSSDLADQVFDAQAGHMITFMAKTLSELLEENRSLKASLKAREASKPRGDGGRPPEASKEEAGKLTWQEAFGR